MQPLGMPCAEPLAQAARVMNATSTCSLLGSSDLAGAGAKNVGLSASTAWTTAARRLTSSVGRMTLRLTQAHGAGSGAEVANKKVPGKQFQWLSQASYQGSVTQGPDGLTP